jgi:hypothetical protein
MKKTILPALSALGLLAACSGAAEAPKEEAAAEADAPAATAAADDDNDSAEPAADDHEHGDGEGQHKDH